MRGLFRHGEGLGYTKKSLSMQLMDSVSQDTGPTRLCKDSTSVPTTLHPTLHTLLSQMSIQAALIESSSLSFLQWFLFLWILNQVPFYTALPSKLLNHTGNPH